MHGIGPRRHAVASLGVRGRVASVRLRGTEVLEPEGVMADDARFVIGRGTGAGATAGRTATARAPGPTFHRQGPPPRDGKTNR